MMTVNIYNFISAQCTRLQWIWKCKWSMKIIDNKGPTLTHLYRAHSRLEILKEWAESSLSSGGLTTFQTDVLWLLPHHDLQPSLEIVQASLWLLQHCHGHPPAPQRASVGKSCPLPGMPHHTSSIFQHTCAGSINQSIIHQLSVKFKVQQII